MNILEKFTVYGLRFNEGRGRQRLGGGVARCLMLAALLLAGGGMTAQAQVAKKLGQPVSGLYTSRALSTKTNTEGSATVVVLNDLEDHSWSYYSDGTTPEQLHSLSPADVKITYLGNGTSTVTAATAAEAVENPTSFSRDASGVQVGPGATANAFVYFKTLERENANGTGNLKYTTIPNPFQVRPTGNDGTVTPATTNVIIQGYGSRSDARGSVSYTYYDENNSQQSGSVSISGTGTNSITIAVKVGTQINFTLTRTSTSRTVYFSAAYENGTSIASGSRNSSGSTNYGPYNITASIISLSVYRGFYAWRVKQKSASLTVTDVNGNAFANNIIPAETEVRFATTSSSNDDTIVFEALWAQAYVQAGSTNLTTYSNSYERNFHVISSSTQATNLQKSYPCTVIGRNPNSTSNNATRTVTGGFTAAADTKFEDVTFSNATTSTYTGAGKYLIIGRGCNSGTVNIVSGINANATNTFKFRVESGTYNNLYFMGSNGVTTGHMTAIMGCDYDRATGANSNLKINTDILMSNSGTGGTSGTVGTERFHCTVKSGNYDLGSYGEHVQFYLSSPGQANYAKRTLIIEGGIFSDVSGGMETNSVGDHLMVDMRIKGGTINGVTYGAAENAAGNGHRRMIITGGTFKGWIAGGANGTQTSGGLLTGDTYIYFGGTAECNSNGSNTTMGNGDAKGGNIFGAGSGNSGAGEGATVGQVSNSTVIIADNCTVERDVYGGGNYGFVTDGSSNKSDIYFYGGTVNGSIYGGSNMQKGQNVNIYTKGTGTVKGNIFGGSNQRGVIAYDVTMSLGGGTVEGSVFGGGYGPGSNDCGVSGNVTIGMTGGTIKGGLYGGSNTRGTIAKSVTMNISGGIIEDGVYGGGYGPSTSACGVTNNVTIRQSGGTITGGLYGGANENGNIGGYSAITISGGTTDTVFGGGHGTASNSCNIGSTSTITMTSGTVTGGIYGGGNVRSVITGATSVNVNGGTVGASNARANVYGGGLGENTRAANSVTVKIGADNATSGATIYGDVYGGSAKGVTNYTGSATSGTTAVTLNAGTVYGSIYGGGYGPGGENADVYGAVTVTVNGGSVKPATGNPSSIFGCNNVSGTPKSTVSVIVNATDATTLDGEGNKVYAINGVYGGGNEAHYNPTTVTTGNPSVHIVGCTSSIKDVYGGGNAAAVPMTNVLVDGGDIYRVFGGGNGESGTPAHVGYRNNVVGSTSNPYSGTGVGKTNVVIHGGEIYQVFGGSNRTGTIRDSLKVSVAKDGTCPIAVHSLYSGGNQAPSALGNITVGCMEVGDMIDSLFCGANQADITGNVNFTMTGGRIGNLFGGNNIDGNVSGTITLTVNWDNSCSNNHLGNVFGGGNLATFGTAGSPKAPTVNILNGTVSGNVYGGGRGNLVDGSDRGKAGKVTGNPIVNIGDNEQGHTATVEGDVYGGGDAADVAGTPVITVNDCNTSIGNLYGGGNAADIDSASIIFNAGTVTGMAFGGGHGDKNASSPSKYADVAHGVNFVIYGGTLAKVFAGSNSKGTIHGTSNLTVNKTGTCAMKIGQIYGGGNEADGVASTINIGCTGALAALGNGERYGYDKEGIGAVYGGANQANIGTSEAHSDITVNINSGIVDSVFGGNNTSGTIYGDIEVNIEKTTESNTCGWYVGSVYGGGNLAAYTGSPAVNILNGTVSKNVYGGGNGDPDDATQMAGAVTGTPVVTIGDTRSGKEDSVAIVTGDVYGGGNAAKVVGTPQVRVPNKCNTSIGYVYGGGNAADVSGTDIVINGGTITGDVYGGGHGDKASLGAGHSNKAANVSGNVSVVITGGTINRVFAGSNTNGTISGTNNTLNINKGNNSCDMHITEVYGGGNLAAGNATSISIGCTGGNTEGISDVYGGARQADVGSDITLNITGGKINRVFGGNNVSGDIDGDITVNVEWGNSCATNSLGYVYGAGNEAPYTQKTAGHPEVNILNGTIDHHVFGGGLGETAEVTGNPKVTIGDTRSGKESYVAWVKGDVYGGGDAADVSGTTRVDVLAKDNNRIDGDVYGGGNAADVTSTDVNIYGGTINRVFGGGHGDNTVQPAVSANVSNGTDVNIAGGTISKVFAGSNLSGTITGTMTLAVNKTGSCAMKIGEVYGGGNEAPSSACSITIGCTGTLTAAHTATAADNNATPPSAIGYTLEGIGDVYGGANNALVTGDITLNINSGMVYRVFGGNNTGNTVNGEITVNINKTSESNTCGWYVGYVYGGGNNAPYSNAGNYPAVNVSAGKVTYNVYGGGKGSGAKVTGNPKVTLSGTAHIGGNVFGGGNAAEVEGNTNVILKN